MEGINTGNDFSDDHDSIPSSDILIQAVNQTRESIIITDACLDKPGPRIIYVNPGFTAMTGYSKEEVIGKTPRLLQGPKTDPTVLKDLRKKLEKGDFFSGETFNYRKDGTEFILQWEISPLKDNNGEITHYLAVQRDVTEEQELKELLEETQEIANIGGWRYDLKQGSFFLSKKTCDIYGFEPEVSINKEKLIASYDQEHQPIIRKAFDELIEEGKPFDEELRFWNRKGKRLWVRAIGKPFYDGGQIMKVGGSLQDITEEKKAKEDLKFSETLFENIFNQSENAIFLLRAKDGKIQKVNEKGIKLFDIKEEVLLGEYGPDWLGVPVSREFLDGIDEKELYEDGWSGELFFKTGKGRNFWGLLTVKRFWLNNEIYDVFDVKDTTERKRMEDRLRESEETFRAFAEKSLVGVYMYQDGVMQYANPKVAEITGYPLEEVKGKSPLDIAHPEDKKVMWEKIQARESGRSNAEHYEFRFYTKQGELRHAELFGSKIMYKGKPAIIGTMLDITERKQAEEKLLENQHFIEKVLNNSPNLIHVYDYTTHQFVFVSHELKDSLGYSAEEINHLQNGVADLIHPEDIDRVYQAYYHNFSLKDGEINEVQYRMKTKGGEWRWVSSTDTPFRRDEKGQLTQVLSTVQDITEKKEAEQDIVEKQRFIESVAENSPNVIHIYDFEQGKFIYSNRYLINILGFTQEEFEAFSNGTYDLYHPDDLPVIRNIYYENLNLGDGEANEKEFRMMDKHGEWRWLLSKDMVFKRNSDGGVKEVIGIVQDITDRKNAEESLKKNEALFRQLFQNAPIGIVILDKNFKIQTANEGFREIFGYDPDKTISYKVNDLIVPEGYQEEAIQFSSRTMEGNVRYVETVRMDKEGNLIPVLIYGVPVFYEEETISIFGIYVDISDRKKVEEDLKKQTNELLRSNAELEQFAYVTSHNLRSPVVNLKSLVGFFDSSELQNEENQFVFQKIEQSVGQLEETLNDIIDIVARKKELSKPKELLYFEEIFDKIQEVLDSRINKLKATIHTDFSKAPKIHYLRSFLESIMQNLLSNALKYCSSDQEPVISFETWPSNGYVCLKVSDNGVGINLAEHGNKLFNLYKRFHKEIPGKGIGLYLVKSQVESLGGEIIVESEAGKGTDFYLYLRDFVN